MTFLSEDPIYLTAGFLILAAGFVAALRVTQQGKYLMLACASVILALLTLAVEQIWVTDNERIEQVVYELRDAVKNSNAEAVLSHLAPNVQLSKQDSALSPDATRELIRSNVKNLHFDLLRVGQLRTNVGEQSRRGTADFQVMARATSQVAGNVDSGSALTTWSLGFQEMGPGIWKVVRISPVSIPPEVLALGGPRPTRPGGLQLGFQGKRRTPRRDERTPEKYRGPRRPVGSPASPYPEADRRPLPPDLRPDNPNRSPAPITPAPATPSPTPGAEPRQSR